MYDYRDPVHFGATTRDPLQSGLTWSLAAQPFHFDFGYLLNCMIADAIVPTQIGVIGVHHAGLWECDLADNSLVWSGGVYDLFGLERGRSMRRDEALGHYSEDSRAKLDRIRSYAIRTRTGFTLDVEIRAALVGQTRRMRIIGAPVYEGNIAVRLHGIKLPL